MEKQEELRAYFWNNMYLTGIHSGIQSQHTTAEMFLKYCYPLSDDKGQMVFDWAHNHKTTIVLNGGYAEHLKDLAKFLHTSFNPYPWSYFRESAEALGGCFTNVGIILPEKIYNCEFPTGLHSYNQAAHSGLTLFEVDLARRVSQCKLMS